MGLEAYFTILPFPNSIRIPRIIAFIAFVFKKFSDFVLWSNFLLCCFQ